MPSSLSSVDLGLALAMGDGILFFVLGLPLYRGWVPPNGTYGFRVRATREDPELWRWVNRRAGARLMITGAASAASGWVAWGLGWTTWLVSTVVLLLGCAWMVITGFVEIRRATKNPRPPES